MCAIEKKLMTDVKQILKLNKNKLSTAEQSPHDIPIESENLLDQDQVNIQIKLMDRIRKMYHKRADGRTSQTSRISEVLFK